MVEIKGKYEGYIWLSDATHPTVFPGKDDNSIVLDEEANPFIIEGALFDKANGKSISIKYVDGRYIISEHNVSPDEMNGNDHIIRKNYLAHRMHGVKGLSYLQYWRKEADPLCEEMETLQPDKLVFIGFTD